MCPPLAPPGRYDQVTQSHTQSSFSRFPFPGSALVPACDPPSSPRSSVPTRFMLSSPPPSGWLAGRTMARALAPPPPQTDDQTRPSFLLLDADARAPTTAPEEQVGVHQRGRRWVPWCCIKGRPPSPPLQRGFRGLAWFTRW